MIRDMVHETANAIGAALTINLIGPVAGRTGFLSALGANGIGFYFIEDGAQWECGVGQITAGSPNTWTRTTVLTNSSGNTSRVNFPGLVNVYNAIPASRMLFLNQNGPAAVTATGQALVTAADAVAARTALGAMPFLQTAAGIGQIIVIENGANASVTLPAGGSWTGFVLGIHSTNLTFLSNAPSRYVFVAAGGSVIATATPNVTWFVVTWRQA